MSRTEWLLITCLFSFYHVDAQVSQNKIPIAYRTISEITAKTVGLNFLHNLAHSQNGKSITDLTLLYKYAANSDNNVNLKITDTIVYMYVFSTVPTDGFIIVSADNAVMPILGYSDNNKFSVKGMPTNISGWLKNYASQIKYGIDNNLQPSDQVKNLWQNLINNISNQKSNSVAIFGEKPIMMGGGNLPSSIAPLLTTNWNQSPDSYNTSLNSYNIYCPPFDSSLLHDHAVTGCVATATAQIVNYWKYPAKGFGILNYTDSTGNWVGDVSTSFGATKFQWNLMANQIIKSTTPDSIRAIATLIRQVGGAVNMNYNYDESGSNININAVAALKNYFNYNKNLHYISRNYLNPNSIWTDTLQSELASNRPILYGGSGSGGGHCFVLDGYETWDGGNLNNQTPNSYTPPIVFHVNWGWAGSCNGYYFFEYLHPQSGGTGGAGYVYDYSQSAVIGIQPPPVSSYLSYKVDLNSNLTSTPTSGVINYLAPLTIQVNIRNDSSNNFVGDFGALIYDSSMNFIDSLSVIYNQTLQSGYTFTNPLSFTTLGKISLLPNTYYIRIFFRAKGGDWQIVDNYSSYNNSIKIKVVNASPIEMNSAFSIIPNPPLIHGQFASISLNVKNVGATTYYGQYGLFLYDLTGHEIQQIGTTYLDSKGLPANSTYTSPLVFNDTINASLKTGDYYLILWQYPKNDTTWHIVGSSMYNNPIKISIIPPPLLPDSYENNDSVQVAYQIPLNYSKNSINYFECNDDNIPMALPTKSNKVHANLNIASDVDFYKIILNKGYTNYVNFTIYDANNDTSLKYPNGQYVTLTAQTIFYYSFDGKTWSTGYQNRLPHGLKINGADTLYIQIIPKEEGSYGTYTYQLQITRVPICSLPLTPKINQIVIPTSCFNKKIELNIPSASIYSWYLNNTIINNATDSFYTPTQSGYYKAKLTDTIANCSILTDSVLLNVSNFQNRLFTSDTIKVSGVDSLLLDAGAGYNSYLWNTGATIESIYAKKTGKYLVNVQCGASSTNYSYEQFSSGNNSTKYITIQDANQLHFTNEMTILLKMRFEGPLSNSTLIEKGNNAYRLTLDGNSTALTFTYQNIDNVVGLKYFPTPSQVQNFDWFYIGIVKRSDSSFFYVNGNLVDKAKSTNPIPVNNINMEIGSGFFPNVGGFDGSMDDISFWNRALTQLEVAQLGHCLTGKESGCVGYYNFEGGNAMKDYSIYNNSAIQNGSTNTYVQSDITSCSAAVLSDSVFVSIINPTILQNDTTVCLNTTVNLALKNSSTNLKTINWSNGAITPSIQVKPTTSTKFWVNVSDGYQTGSDTVNITVPSVDTSISYIGNTNLCYGDSITLFASQNSNFFQWLKNNQPVSGATNILLQAKTTGNYRVIVTNSNGCSDTSSVISVTVNSLPAIPIITALGSTTFCSGGSVILTSNAITGNQWYKDGNIVSGATNATYTASIGGVYLDSVTNSSGCKAASASTPVIVNPLPTTPIITAGSSTTFCSGNNVVLTSNASSGNQWYKDGVIISGSTNISYTAAIGGVYSDTVINLNGCKSASLNTTVTVNPNPTKPDIIWNGSQFSTSVTNVSYQWLLNSVALNGAISETYKPTLIGLYKIQITDANGCKNISDSFNLVVTAINNPITNTPTHIAKLFPNPASTEVLIKFEEIPAETLIIQLVDNYGRVLKSFSTKNQTTIISLTNLNTGNYYIKIIGNDYNQTKKLIILK